MFYKIFNDSNKTNVTNKFLISLWFFRVYFSKTDGNGYSVCECLSLVFHRSSPDLLLLLYSGELLVLDLIINQTVAVIPVERKMSPFLNLHSCKLRDVIYTLHDNGAIVTRKRIFTNTISLDGKSNYHNGNPGKI